MSSKNDFSLIILFLFCNKGTYNKGKKIQTKKKMAAVIKAFFLI